MPRYNNDTADNMHVTQRYHCVRQGTTLNEHNFEWIGTKHQLVDILSKSLNAIKISLLWQIVFHKCLYSQSYNTT